MTKHANMNSPQITIFKCDSECDRLEKECKHKSRESKIKKTLNLKKKNETINPLPRHK